MEGEAPVTMCIRQDPLREPPGRVVLVALRVAIHKTTWGCEADKVRALNLVNRALASVLTAWRCANSRCRAGPFRHRFTECNGCGGELATVVLCEGCGTNEVPSLLSKCKNCEANS